MNKFSVPVLDHGFVRLRNLSGPTRRMYDEDDNLPEIRWKKRDFDADDVDPAQAARMSFDKMDEERSIEQDHRLSDYLMRHWHTSPFEMVEVWLEMKMPIFVARQFVRHRTAAINEVSGRYITLPAEWYIPETVGGKAPNVKQGQADVLPYSDQEEFRTALDLHCARGYSNYTNAIGQGVAPEHARMFLSLNHYTHWLWKQDLHNILNFLRLRDHSNAQVEARAYAQAIDSLLRKQLPVTMDLYDQYRRLENKVADPVIGSGGAK